MICKNCGADIGDKGKCEYCDTVYFEEVQTQELVLDEEEALKEKREENKPEKIGIKITSPTKVAAFFCFCCIMMSLPEMKNRNIIVNVFSIMALFFIFCVPTQLISARKIKCHLSDQEEKGKARTKLTKATIIVVILWTVVCIIMAPDLIAQIGWYKTIWAIIFEVFFMGCITQLISGRTRKRHKAEAQKQTTRSQLQPGTYFSSKPYDNMDVREFALFCCNVLGKSGFTRVSVIKTSEAQGIDIVAFKNGLKYGIQCKYSSFSIGIGAVEKVIAGKNFFGCQTAAILTNQFFDRSAEELADRNDILLWNRNKLDDMIAIASNEESNVS